MVIFSDLVGLSVSFMTDAIACTFQQHAVPSRIVLQSLQKLRDSDGLMLMDEFAVPAKFVVSISQDFDNFIVFNRTGNIFISDEFFI